MARVVSRSERARSSDTHPRQRGDDDEEWIRDAESLIYAGAHRTLAAGLPREHVGVLVDEQYGADVARRAKADGAILAMPVEKSGQDEFDFEYGDAFGTRIEAFDPTFTTVLVRYNPDGDAPLNARQTARLR
jgi:myo-inositol catabolism protein IolC